jgi:ATP/maltotriose-dependent transcriptional regulator MalT
MTAGADELLSALDLPTLILHSVGDRMNSFEYGRRLASDIANARLVALESDNHIVLEDEPAWAIFVDEVSRFMEPDGQPSASSERLDALLSSRELEVLRLVAVGRDNVEIAAELHLSTRTVERHLQNVYGKLGLQGRSARIAAAARLLTPV